MASLDRYLRLLGYDTNLKVGPPIRTEEDRRALIAAVIDGTIDCIATDHAPHTNQDKETTFDLAAFGMIGLESCFGVVNYILHKESGLDLMNLISLLTSQPRKIMGFKSDLFSEGSPAEITIIDTEKEWIFSRQDIKSKSTNSPYIGRKLVGKVLHTISKSYVFQ